MFKCVISDLDGTLVDTFEANFQAYWRAFQETGKILTREKYKQCFGLGFKDFIANFEMQSFEEDRIHSLKSKYYPEYFHLVKLNEKLLELLETLHATGTLTGLATVSSKVNVQNLLTVFPRLKECFSVIVTGEDIKKHKPDPEIYLTVMKKLEVDPENTVIFEDSEVGLEAAKRSGAKVVKIQTWSGN